MAGVYMHSPFTMCGPELSTSVITRPREVKNSFNFSRHRGMGLSSTTISNSRPALLIKCRSVAGGKQREDFSAEPFNWLWTTCSLAEAK